MPRPAGRGIFFFSATSSPHPAPRLGHLTAGVPMRFTSLLSRHLWAPIAMVLVLGSSAAYADTPAEIYIRDNVQKGLSILNDTSLPREAKRAQFQTFLEGLTDVHRIAIFT